MSEKEMRRRNKARHVCRQAWIYMRRTSVDSLSMAMRIAWMRITSKLRIHHSKVRGVMFGNRQRLLQRLSCYEEKDVRLAAVREYDNEYDRYAIEIIASVSGKGSASLGYVSRNLAMGLASLMDEGAWVIPMMENITGGGRKSFGLNYSFVIVK